MKSKGFSLIELAIVILILGILSSIIIKSKSLIDNARMKVLINEVRKWKMDLLVCYDRTNHYPGDTDNDGFIDTNPLDPSCINKACKCFQNLKNPVKNNIKIGPYSFYIYVGVDNNSSPTTNVLAVCGSSDCQTAITNQTILDFLTSLDIAIDGNANGNIGFVRGSNGITITNGVVTNIGILADWNLGTTAGAIYFLDRQP